MFVEIFLPGGSADGSSRTNEEEEGERGRS
jgi:hypothetical protein